MRIPYGFNLYLCWAVTRAVCEPERSGGGGPGARWCVASRPRRRTRADAIRLFESAVTPQSRRNASRQSCGPSPWPSPGSGDSIPIGRSSDPRRWRRTCASTIGSKPCEPFTPQRPALAVPPAGCGASGRAVVGAGAARVHVAAPIGCHAKSVRSTRVTSLRSTMRREPSGASVYRALG